MITELHVPLYGDDPNHPIVQQDIELSGRVIGVCARMVLRMERLMIGILIHDGSRFAAPRTRGIYLTFTDQEFDPGLSMLLDDDRARYVGTVWDIHPTHVFFGPAKGQPFGC